MVWYEEFVAVGGSSELVVFGKTEKLPERMRAPRCSIVGHLGVMSKVIFLLGIQI